jgi:hypothetical protein
MVTEARVAGRRGDGPDCLGFGALRFGSVQPFRGAIGFGMVLFAPPMLILIDEWFVLAPIFFFRAWLIFSVSANVTTHAPSS